MRDQPYDVCIVSQGAVATSPRVEKEAKTLSDAGYRVAVVVCNWSDVLVDWDARLQAGQRWDLYVVDQRERARTRSAKGLASIALRVAARSILSADVPGVSAVRAPLTALASSERFLPLLSQTLRVPARLYLGHGLTGLAAVAVVARVRGARFAFDAEDDHFGELTAELQRGVLGRIAHELQDRYLPRAAFVTTAADGMADALAERHGIARPTVVLNAFSLRLREQLDGLTKERAGARLSLCWYSQTVGLDRGLQDVIAALGRVKGDCELHIRGTLDADVERALRAEAASAGIERCMIFHPQAHPDELLSRVAEHDVGLAVEQPVSDNRRVAVTNKLLFYMLAGVAIIATATPGQRGIASTTGDAIALYEPGDPVGLAKHIQALHDDPLLLAERKRQALQLANERFNAELELSKLPPLVAAALRA